MLHVIVAFTFCFYYYQTTCYSL